MKQIKPKIIPLIKKCRVCGKAVKNHHFDCDSCHAKKQKELYWKEIKKLKPKPKSVLKKKCKMCGGYGFWPI